MTVKDLINELTMEDPNSVVYVETGFTTAEAICVCSRNKKVFINVSDDVDDEEVN